MSIVVNTKFIESFPNELLKLCIDTYNQSNRGRSYKWLCWHIIQGKLSIDNNRGITVCNIIRGLIFDTEHQLENQHYNDWLKPKCLCWTAQYISWCYKKIGIGIGEREREREWCKLENYEKFGNLYSFHAPPVQPQKTEIFCKNFLKFLDEWGYSW